MGNKIEAKSDKTPFLTHFKDSFTFLSNSAWSNSFSNRYSLRPCLIESSSGLRQLAGSNETTRNFTLHAPKGGIMQILPFCLGCSTDCRIVRAEGCWGRGNSPPGWSVQPRHQSGPQGLSFSRPFLPPSSQPLLRHPRHPPLCPFAPLSWSAFCRDHHMAVCCRKPSGTVCLCRRRSGGPRYRLT